jgi:hypothetical protein
MTELPKPPKPSPNLYERIRARFEPFGGVDDLELPPREPARDPPDFDTADYDPLPMMALSGGADGNQQHAPEVNPVRAGRQACAKEGDA